ncbi:MAG: prolipoprotein diacylglyceryl transferase [Thermoleophilaceae bacterium]
MLPEIEVGPITLQTFGICFALGMLVAGAVVARRLEEIGKPRDWAYEAVFAAVLGGIVGARLDWLIQNWDEASGDLLGNLVAGDGLVWLGGLVGGSIGVLLWARWRGFLEPRLFDLGAPALAIGQAIGRVGCQLSGDGDYGRATDMFWGMAYPDGVVPTLEQVHPTPVFETIALGLIALVLWRLRDRVQPGALFALYLVLAGVERILIELIRRNDEVLVGLTQAQLISVAMVAGGLYWLARLRTGARTAAPAT